MFSIYKCFFKKDDLLLIQRILQKDLSLFGMEGFPFVG